MKTPKFAHTSIPMVGNLILAIAFYATMSLAMVQGAGNAADPDDEHVELATDLYELLGKTEKEIKEDEKKKEAATRKNVTEAVTQYRLASPDVPDEFFDEYEAIMLKIVLSRTTEFNYRKRYIQFVATNYDKEEMRQLIVFYKSPLGKKVLANRSKWDKENQEVTRQIQQEWSKEVNRQVAEEYVKLADRWAAELESKENSDADPESEAKDQE